MKASDILMDKFQAKDPESTNYKVLFLKYIKYWYWYLLGILLSLSLAFIYLQSATKEYPISTTILIPTKSTDFTQNAVVSDLENYQSTKLVENEAEVLSSASLMSLALQQLNFNVSYYTKDNYFRDREIFGAELPIEVTLHEYDSMAFYIQDLNTSFLVHILDENTYELEDNDQRRTRHRLSEVVTKPFGEFSVHQSNSFSYPQTIRIDFQNPMALSGRYNSKLEVRIVNKQASVLRLNLTDPVPQKGILVLNKLVEIYNQEAVRDKNKTAENTISFIDEQLEELTSELRKIEQEIEGYKTQNRITQLSTDAQQYAIKSTESEGKLSEITVQLDVLESIENYLLVQESDYKAVPSSLTIQDPTLSNLIGQYNTLQMDRQRMLRTTQPNNPLVINLSEQLQSVKTSILENIKNIKSGIEITRNSLLARTTEFDSRSERIPEIERQLMEISRQQSIKQDHYTYLVQKREEAALSLAATNVSTSRTIDPAMAGNSPVKPNKIIVLGIALFFGFTLPFGLVFLNYQLRQKLLVKNDVSSRTSIPILGEISHHNGKQKFIITNHDRSPVAEQFRLIRTNLLFALNSIDNKVILVTSTLSGEGKTFFSLNLGLSLGLVDKKVVICEFDLRKPALLNYLNTKSNRGISDFLIDDTISVSDIKIRHPQLPENITLLGCGTIPDNPSELMLTDKLASLMDQLKEEFDIIIIDSAPVGQVADAFSLSKYADITSYVMRYNYTPSDALDFLIENNKGKKLKNPAIVLNDAKLEMSYGYGYYASDKGNKKKSYSVAK